MKKIFPILVVFIFVQTSVFSQGKYERKFEQLGTELPTPNTYRTGSGAPGPSYWQQKADYEINVEINDESQVLTGSEKITYFNNSPDVLEYLWVQLDQNVRARDSNSPLTRTMSMPQNDTIIGRFLQGGIGDIDYDGGFKITAVKDNNKRSLPHTINKTMMRIDIPKPMKTGDTFTFTIDWSYNINDRMLIGGRGGYEYFPADGNYSYTIAQWYPRMAVYDDVNGWQNKQFLGAGEFALTFGDFKVNITVPSDHVVAATGTLQNAKEVLTTTQLKRLESAKASFDKPVIIVTEKEAREKEKAKAPGLSMPKMCGILPLHHRENIFGMHRPLILTAKNHLPCHSILRKEIHYGKRSQPRQWLIP